jgi:iron complex transport system substrate-binding protein
MLFHTSKKVKIKFAIISLIGAAAAIFLSSCAPAAKGKEAVVSQNKGFPYSFKDDWDRSVVIKKKPLTMVSLAPSVTQIICALDKADMLRGVTKWCDNPEAASVEKIGNMTEPDIERIIEIRPDIVIGTEMTPRHVYDTLENVGITCAIFKHQGLDDVLSDMLQVSNAIGDSEGGGKIVEKLRDRENAILASVPKDKKAKVALLYDLDSMGSAGRGSWVDDMLKTIGLDNIANRAKSSWPRLSREALLTEQPEFIILPLPADAADADALRERIEGMKNDPVWSKVEAIKNGRVILVPANYLNIPGPRILDAMQFIRNAVETLKSSK